ncbi:MAG: hypothetical protein HYZ31_09440 [Gammaproteobacteria bacterium]|jgi:ABC-type uncharacterized transport system auxiliary subunit|nr:hypothetical protein [Gammaproteobacteria bacterium]
MKQIWTVVLALMLTACGFSAGNIPADHFYRLPAAKPVVTAVPVTIQSVRADGIYNERALLFVESARPLELKRYDYHFWSQTPAKLTQSYLSTCLVYAGAEHMTDITLQTRQWTPVIESFERVLESGKAQVLVKLRINQRLYEANVMATSMEMHDTIEAYGQAMQTICEAMARDL